MQPSQKLLERVAEEERAFAVEMTTLAARAHQLGLHVTGHALEHAVRALGYEMAGEIEHAGSAARGEL